MLSSQSSKLNNLYSSQFTHSQYTLSQFKWLLNHRPMFKLSNQLDMLQLNSNRLNNFTSHLKFHRTNTKHLNQLKDLNSKFPMIPTVNLLPDLFKVQLEEKLHRKNQHSDKEPRVFLVINSMRIHSHNRGLPEIEAPIKDQVSQDIILDPNKTTHK